MDLVKKNNEFYLHFMVKQKQRPFPKKFVNFCGLDPGIRTFYTCFSNVNGITEYENSIEHLTKKLNAKIDLLKSLRKPKRIRKSKLSRLEKKKSNLTDNLHRSVINDLVDKQDVIFLGDIKSHDIVKESQIESRL